MKRRILLILVLFSLILAIASCSNPEKEYLEVEDKIKEIESSPVTNKEEYDLAFDEKVDLLESFIKKYPDYERTKEFEEELVNLEYDRVLWHVDRIKKSKPKTQEEGEKLLNEWKALLVSFIKKYPSHEKSQSLRLELKQLHSMLQELPEALAVLEDVIKYNEDENFNERLLAEKIVLTDAYLKQEFTEEKKKDLVELIKQYREKYETGQFKDVIKGIERTMDLRIGQPVIEFKTKDTKGKDFSFNQYKGKVLLLDFWASWCKPCTIEMPNVISIYNKYHSKGFEIVGVSMDQDLDAMKEYLKNNKISWRQIADGKGWNSEFGRYYNIKSIPSTFLIDRNGIIRYTNLRGEALEKAVKELIEEKGK